MNLKILFRPDGTGQCLYSEAIDLSALGRLHVKRATHIEFDNGKQVWRVKDRKGRKLHSAPSRQACLQWEDQHFNGDTAA